MQSYISRVSGPFGEVRLDVFISSSERGFAGDGRVSLNSQSSKSCSVFFLKPSASLRSVSESDRGSDVMILLLVGCFARPQAFISHILDLGCQVYIDLGK
jgi:hypothetical protein